MIEDGAYTPRPFFILLLSADSENGALPNVQSLLHNPMQVAGGAAALWYSVTFGAAFYQELKVGWPRFERKGRMAIFVAMMLLQGTVQQVCCKFVLVDVSMNLISNRIHLTFFCPCSSWCMAITCFSGKRSPGSSHTAACAPSTVGLGPIYSARSRPRASKTYQSESPFSFAVAPSLVIRFFSCAPSVGNLFRRDDVPCIYVSNHQSSVDFALYYALPHNHFKGLCAVAKSSIMLVPGFGAMTALCGGNTAAGNSLSGSLKLTS